MLKSPTKSNSRALLQTLLDRNLSLTSAAEQSGVSQDLLGKLIRDDRHISIRTAGKLKAAFGDSAVKFHGGTLC